MSIKGNDLIQWAKRVLADDALKYECVVETPWSMVFKIKTNRQCVYLKKTPTALFIEASIFNFIEQACPGAHIPKVLFENKDLDCFIMSDCGEQSLRTQFAGKIDVALLLQGLQSYSFIQRSLANKKPQLLALGLPDWGAERLPELFQSLISQHSFLQDEGLTPKEIEQLKHLQKPIESLANALSGSLVRETLVNADFNENNLILDKQTQTISVIDLGESVVAHPFFSVAAHINNMARRYKLNIHSDTLKSIQQKWLAQWSDVDTPQNLQRTLLLVQKLLPVYLALGIYRLQEATCQQSKRLQNWFIKDCLRLLLQSKD